MNNNRRLLGITRLIFCRNKSPPEPSDHSSVENWTSISSNSRATVLQCPCRRLPRRNNQPSLHPCSHHPVSCRRHHRLAPLSTLHSRIAAAPAARMPDASMDAALQLGCPPSTLHSSIAAPVAGASMEAPLQLRCSHQCCIAAPTTPLRP